MREKHETAEVGEDFKTEDEICFRMRYGNRYVYFGKKQVN
jgi:hypothetical protein